MIMFFLNVFFTYIVVRLIDVYTFFKDPFNNLMITLQMECMVGAFLLNQESEDDYEEVLKDGNSKLETFVYLSYFIFNCIFRNGLKFHNCWIVTTTDSTMKNYLYNLISDRYSEEIANTVVSDFFNKYQSKIEEIGESI